MLAWTGAIALLAVALLVVSGLGRWGGSHRAGLVWLGALLYFVYAFVVYAMAVHFNSLFLAYVAVLGLSTYAAFYAADELRASDRALLRRPRTRLAG
ncbi:hypothetical protein [Nocardioides daphniae]|uniref:Uncharacterized protein n=1 Tax=Nocardioides daphniae TaxID=402297 RepID=A0ABQ1QL11_9ACTN|nr:hypothetical protein [Nocardioides daphniae]GGD30244.1 hypothetical protein GCM10007231_32150 [Nocardioides daphniae]